MSAHTPAANQEMRHSVAASPAVTKTRRDLGVGQGLQCKLSPHSHLWLWRSKSGQEEHGILLHKAQKLGFPPHF